MFWRVIEDCVDVIAEFTGKKEMKQFKKSLANFYESFTKDKKMGQWLTEVKDYALEAIQNPDIIDTVR